MGFSGKGSSFGGKNGSSSGKPNGSSGKQTAQPSGEDNPSKTLYVGGIAEEVTEEILRQAFEPFGPLREAKIKMDRDGKARGFGFLEYEDEEDCEAAIDNMHESELFGRVLTVNKSKGLAVGGKGGARLDRCSKPIWADDFFFKRDLEGMGLKVSPS